MTVVTALAVAVGAAIGAPCRYLLDLAVQRRHSSAFPWGILLVNLLGSTVLGALLGAGDLPPAVLAGAGTGWCGAFTTYSTFGHDTVQLVRDGAARAAALNVALSVAGGLAAATLGFALGRFLS